MKITSDSVSTKWVFIILWKLSSIISIIVGTLFLGMSFNYIEKNEMVLIIAVLTYIVVRSIMYNCAPIDWLKEFNKGTILQLIKAQPLIGPLYLTISIGSLITFLSCQMYGWLIYLIADIAILIISHAYTNQYKDKT